MGPVLPNSNDGASMGGGYDSGVTFVKGTLSEICWPAWEKKELNSSAMAVGSLIVSFGVIRLGILVDLFLLELVSSLTVSQVFLGFFAYWVNLGS